ENASKNRLQLLGCEGEGLAAVVDLLAHLADAARAAGAALVTVEHVLRSRRARFNGGGHVTLAQTVAVADVQGRRPDAIANGSYSRLNAANASRSHSGIVRRTLTAPVRGR